jgi:hypothetical protein
MAEGEKFASMRIFCCCPIAEKPTKRKGHRQ